MSPIIVYNNNYIQFPQATGGGGSNPVALNFPITEASFAADANGTDFSTASFLKSVARYNYVIFGFYGGIEGGMNGGAGTTFSEVMSYAKTWALDNYTAGHVLKTGIYQIDNEFWSATSDSGAWLPLKINTLNANEGWRVQSTGYPTTSHPITDPNEAATYWFNNDTSKAPYYWANTVGSVAGPSTVINGPVNWSQWSAWYEVQILSLGLGGSLEETGGCAANPYLDFISRDNQFLYPEVAGCWASNGTIYSQSSQFGGGSAANSTTTGAIPVGAWIQQGFYDALAMTRAISTLWTIGNVDAFIYYGDSNCPPIVFPNTPQYDLVNTEAPIGQSYSVGARSTVTFKNLMAACQIQESYSANGYSGVIWNMEGRNAAASGNWSVDGAQQDQSNWVEADWQSARYQMGLCHYLRWIVGAPSNNDVPFWFDEFDTGSNNGTNLGWLGQPIGSRCMDSSGNYIAPNATALSAYNEYGVITLLFQNGVVYIFPNNVSGDGTPTAANINMSTGYLQGGGGTHITYTVTPSGSVPLGVTSGATFNSLQMTCRDAVFTKGSG